MVKPTQVTLHDGRVVDACSEEARAEYEARFLLAIPTKEQRREYLAGVTEHRGRAARTRLESLALKIHKARKVTERKVVGGRDRAH